MQSDHLDQELPSLSIVEIFREMLTSSEATTATDSSDQDQGCPQLCSQKLVTLLSHVYEDKGLVLLTGRPISLLIPYYRKGVAHRFPRQTIRQAEPRMDEASIVHPLATASNI